MMQNTLDVTRTLEMPISYRTVSRRFKTRATVKTLLRVTAASFAMAAAVAQQTPVEPTFEAASIKPSSVHDRTLMQGGPGSRDPGRITYTNVNLRDVIGKAYS